MLDYLRRGAREEGFTNVSFVQATWQDAPDSLQADIVICSHVLYAVTTQVPFSSRL